MIRRYAKSDIPVMIGKIKQFADESETYRKVSFDHAKVEALLFGNVTNNRFFCNLYTAEDGLTIYGGLCGMLFEYTFSREVYAADLIFFVEPERRGLKAATALVESYVEWAKARNVREVRLSSTTGKRSEGFALLCEHLGFNYLGPNYNMEI